jgi:hypothetical protein
LLCFYAGTSRKITNAREGATDRTISNRQVKLKVFSVMIAPSALFSDIDTIIKLLLLVVPLGKTLIVCMEVA